MARNRLFVILVGVTLVIGGYVTYQMLGTARLAVTTQPEEAIVRVDGRFVGRTPVDVDVATGTHLISVQHSYYAVVEEQIGFSRGDRVARRLTLLPADGQLELLSNPRGAWVEIDGKPIAGVTPEQVTLPSGPHTVIMGMSERRSEAQSVVVMPGTTVEVNLDLNIDPHGTVTISTDPRGAHVEFVGTDAAYAPGGRIKIGEYVVRVSKPGYETEEFRYTVRYGNNLHHVHLKRAYGALNVRATPEHAQIRVSYPDKGGVRREEYRPGMRIPVGPVEIRAGAMGFRTAYRKVQMSSKGYSTRLTLETMNVKAGQEIRDRLRDGSDGPVMVVVPAGRFMMGDPRGGPSERPEHVVNLTQPFAGGKYEVSVGEYLVYARATGARVPGKVNKADTRLPMRDLEWKEAAAYTDWLTAQTGQKYRLPTEAEWEYMARAGSTSTYSFGNDVSEICKYGNIADQATHQIFREWDVVDCDDGYGRLAPVGAFLPNAFGLHDLHGNVTEWVADCGLPEYENAPTDGSAASEGDCQANGFRGGSWDSMPAEAASAYRNSSTMANDDRGIRLVREL